MVITIDGHRSVGNDTRDERAVVKERAGLRTRVEFVPNYTRRRARAKGAGRVELASAGGAIPPRPVAVAAASFGTQDSMEVVIEDDDRTVIPDPLDAPWRHICALRITSNTGKHYVGTGWLIGPRTLVTAGHCVYLHDEGGWPTSIAVIPALNGNLQPYGAAVATRFRTTDGWKAHREAGFDYGAILLDDDAFATAGAFGFASLPDEALASTDANIAGYPADLDHATRQYFHSRRITSSSPTRLFYEIDTFGGQSGSPIWFNIDNRRIAVGIHTTGSSTSNSGTRITDEVFQNLRAWRETARPELQPQRREGARA